MWVIRDPSGTRAHRVKKASINGGDKAHSRGTVSAELYGVRACLKIGRLIALRKDNVTQFQVGLETDSAKREECLRGREPREPGGGLLPTVVRRHGGITDMYLGSQLIVIWPKHR